MIKKKNSPGTKERHLGVILEDMHSQLKLVLEGHTALDVKIEVLGRELKSEIHNLTLGQKDILDYLSRIDDEIQELKKILFQKADLERLQKLETSVTQIELAVKRWSK